MNMPYTFKSFYSNHKQFYIVNHIHNKLDKRVYKVSDMPLDMFTAFCIYKNNKSLVQ